MITNLEADNIKNTILNESINEVTLEELISLLEAADDAYFNTDSVILTDEQYDIYHRFAKQANPTHPYFLGIGSDVRGGKVLLPYQMGSLDQKYENDILDWIISNDIESDLIISDKLDGASAMIIFNKTFQIGYSRGDGIMGADISRHLKQMPSIPTKLKTKTPLTIRGENIISIENFPLLQKIIKTKGNKDYKNARNCVSGIMNSESIPKEAYKYIDFVAYEIVDSELSKLDQLELLTELGFKTVEYNIISDPKTIKGMNLTHLIKDRKLISKYELDGIVIDVDDANKRKQMNPTRDTLNPAYSVKFKITDDSNAVIANFVNLDINISKNGYFKPRIEIEPIDLMGVTITWATGFNMKFIKDNQIGPGCKLKIVRSGDVIPYIMEIVEPSNVEDYTEWFNSQLIGMGETQWTETGVDLVLLNADDNETVRFEQLNAFFDSLGCPHLGEGNLQKLFDMGLEYPELIIELTQEDLSQAIGSKVIGKKIFKGIRDTLNNIPIYKLMGAHPSFGRGVGVRKMKKLWEAFQGDMTKIDDIESIIAVEGFDKKTAMKVWSGYPTFCEFFDYIKQYVSIQEYIAPKEGNLTGKIIVFTGFRNSTLEKQIEAAGGKMGSSVSSKTHYVVTPNPNGSSGKLDKARNTPGVQIISVEDLQKML